MSSLSAPRTWPTATLLPNGHVLVVGGYGGAEESARAELYIPNENIFKLTSDMSTPRANHTATLLPNGEVLVVGGQLHGSPLASAELYDPTTNAWKATGSLHVARCYHTATLLSDGRVLVAGGACVSSPPEYPQGTMPGGALFSVEIYDPASGTWTETDSLHQSRFNHTATLLQNGDVLVTGGLGAPAPIDFKRTPDIAIYFDPPSKNPSPVDLDGGAMETESSAEVYDHKTEKWTTVAPMSKPRFVHTATLLLNGKVLVVGGKPNPQSDSNSSELYDPVTKSWAATGNLPQPVNAHTATLLPNGQVLVVGGANEITGVLKNVEIYNVAKGTWSEVASLKTARSLHTATLLPSGQILVTGGDYSLGDPSFVMASVELLSSTKVTATREESPVEPEQESPPKPTLPGVD